MNMEEFLEKVESNARDLRIGVCPIWQCGGELEYVEDRTNWQEPDLRCKNWVLLHCGVFCQFFYLMLQRGCF